MSTFYTSEKNIQMLVYLLKAHGIRKVIASPGTTNITFVMSLQGDPFFEIYSAADERSAAYMACGLAAESGEPVVLTCTGATASRNYVPGLTEAFYRKLPVLAVTSTQYTGRVGQLTPQVIDRSQIQNDIAVMQVEIPLIHDSEEEWSCNLKLNSALLALRHRGGGPVHINLTTAYSKDFSVETLPEYRVIHRITAEDDFPEITASKIAVHVGVHTKWSEELTKAVDTFCENYNAVVLCDHTSNYSGKYGIKFNLICGQPSESCSALSSIDLLIDIGEVSGAYMSISPKEVWRVNPDGVLRDRFRTLTKLFEMSELLFFRQANASSQERGTSFYESYRECYEQIIAKVPELPFSNIWIAKTTASLLPEDCILHLGILNTLRAWNFFEIPKSVLCYTNSGGFGIDGLVSSLIGASLADCNKLHFIVVGDLAFFYDMNSIANRHVGKNIRILLVNNGLGTEFKNYNHMASQFGKDADAFIAAAGHYGKQSPTLVKHYAEDLGFTYFAASTKEEYSEHLSRFVDPALSEKPILFEVFTNPKDESDALNLMRHISLDLQSKFRQVLKNFATAVLGQSGAQKLRRMLRI